MPGRLEPETLPRRDFLGLAGLWSAAIAITGSLLGMARITKLRVVHPENSYLLQGHDLRLRPRLAISSELAGIYWLPHHSQRRSSQSADEGDLGSKSESSRNSLYFS